jgi:hypothetical protein
MSGKRNRDSLFTPTADDGLDAIDARNDQMLSFLVDKTRRLVQVSKSVSGTLASDKTQLEALAISMDTGSDMMSKGRAALSTITDDASYLGVCKIASLVFWVLVIVYFSLKFGYRWLRRK